MLPDASSSSGSTFPRALLPTPPLPPPSQRSRKSGQSGSARGPIRRRQRSFSHGDRAVRRTDSMSSGVSSLSCCSTSSGCSSSNTNQYGGFSPMCASPQTPSSPLLSPTAASKGQQQQSSSPPPQPRVQKYKTELCRNWELTASCTYGDRCQYAHGAHELRPLFRNVRYKTEPCRNFERDNFCTYGAHRSPVLSSPFVLVDVHCSSMFFLALSSRMPPAPEASSFH